MAIQTFYSRAVDGNTIISVNLTTAGTTANLVSATGNLWLGTSMYMILDKAPELYEVTKYEKYWYNVASVRRAWLQDGTAGYRVDLEKNLVESFVRDYSDFGQWRLNQPGPITPGQCVADGSATTYYPFAVLMDPALSDTSSDYGLQSVFEGLGTSVTLKAILQTRIGLGGGSQKSYTLATSNSTTGVAYNSRIASNVADLVYSISDVKSYDRSPSSIKLEVGFETLPLVTNPETGVNMNDSFFGDIHQKALKSNGKNIIVLGNQTVEIPTTSRVQMDGQSDAQIGVESGTVTNAFGHITKMRLYDRMVDIPTMDVSTPISQYYNDKLKLHTMTSSDPDALVIDLYNGLTSVVGSLASAAATATTKYGGVISSVVNGVLGDGLIPPEYRSNLGYILSGAMGLENLASPSQQVLDKQGLIGDAFLNNFYGFAMYQYYTSKGKLTMPDLSQWLCNGGTLFKTKGDRQKSATFYSGTVSGAPADIIAAGKSFASSGFNTI